jgi:thimet oligopeptidase
MIKRSLLLAALILCAALPLRAIQVQGTIAANAGAPRGGPGVAFKLTPQQITAQFTTAQQGFDLKVSQLLSLPAGARTFENTVKALETASAEYSEATQNLVFLAYVSPDKDVQEAAQKVEVEAGKYSIGLWARPELYEAVKAYADRKEQLEPKEARLLEAMMRGFKSSGHGLSADDKAKLQKMQERMSELGSIFENNINQDNGFIDMTAEQVQGLPQDVLDSLEKVDGKFRVTLKYPDYAPFMKYSKDSDARKALQLAYNNRAVENLPLLSEALKLRDDSAKLLGYESYPHMALDGRMAETPQKVWDFLNKLWPILRVQGEKELAALLSEKKKDDPEASRVESHESSYYGNKLRKALYDLDNEEVKKYFPVDKVVAGTMKVYERVLGVKFTEVKDAETWHSDVRLFRTNDAATGEEIGYFYLDLFPREGKYSHAAAFTIVQGRELELGGYKKPVSAMVANFPKAAPGQPATMPHADVETFFHEFGHIMHQTLTKARYGTFAGSSTAQDFVEAPSQMLENFAWERDVLDEISGHVETGAKIPEELYQKMLKAKSFNNGLSYLTQLAYAMIDMTYHTAVPVETTRIFNQLMELVGLMPVQPGSRSEAAFGHLMGGYGAGYYGYLWSEVFADDIYSRFSKEGIFNPAVGMAWRREVLEKGSERPEMESLVAFLGRQPSEKAFMDRMKGEETLNDRYWALSRLAEERRDQFVALKLEGVWVRRVDGKLLVGVVAWPEEFMDEPGTTEEQIFERVKKVMPEIGGEKMMMAWLGVGA